MGTLLTKFGEVVNGVIKGFDRIVFKGMVRPIMYAAGMQSHLMTQGVLNKDFKTYAMANSKSIVEYADEASKKQTGKPTIYIPSSNGRKEAMVRKHQNEAGIKNGLIGVWSCVEPCLTYRSAYNPAATYPELRHDHSRCKHLYYYIDDPTYGFMSVRLQTWAPYEIQIALNGREWLKRSLDSAGCTYVLHGNKFLHIDEYELAQKFLDAQLEANFEKILNGFVPMAFPHMQDILPNMSYYWTLWQSELATDYIFDKPESLNPLMDDLMRYALISGTGERILKYFGNPVDAKGQPHPKSNPEILSRAKVWYDGLRVRHWNGKNSVKFYNEHNVLRFEMTMNDPSKYKIHRHAENQDKSEPKKLMPIRKGIADITARAKVSKGITDRFTEQMASFEETASLEELISTVSSPIVKDGKRVRALDVFGKDLQFIKAISDPAFSVSAITNKELQNKLADTGWAKGKSIKQLSGKISRHLFMLRKHGIIKKLPNQRKYELTAKGRKLTTAVNVALASPVESLLKLVA